MTDPLSRDRREREHASSPDPAATPVEAGPSALRPYEPPQLTCLGNLRNLVGKTGISLDLAKPDENRP